MENKNEKSFYDIQYILTQLDVNMSLDEVNDKLKGIDFNRIRDNDMLVLSQMVNEGEVRAVKYLLEKGANPDLESSSYHYYKGPAIFFALQNNRSKTAVKLEILKMLIDYGCDMNAIVSWFDEEQEKEVKGSYIEYGLKLGMENLQVMTDSNFSAESRKSAKNKIVGLQGMLSMLQQSNIIMDQEVSYKLKEFLSIETKKSKKVDPKKFLVKALNELDVKDKLYDLPSVAKEVCYSYLENEAFIPSKEWAELIKHLVKISLTFEEVSKDVYEGEAVSFIDDEGWLSQSWEEYNWFSEMVDALSNENAFKNPEWGDLLVLIITECPKFDAESIDEQVMNLIEEPWVQSHKSFKKVKALAEECFEY